MINLQTLLPRAAVLAAGLAVTAHAAAAVSAEEARQLGTTLTEFGATKAGNADGTIPPYTGGLTKAPAAFKPGSGFWADPFADEKPLFRIDAKNMAQHAERLSEAQKQLLATNPNYYLDVYPTHRTIAYPERILKGTLRNATACKMLKDGLALDPACRGGQPFPIPKNGKEAMWNQVLAYYSDGGITTENSRNWVVDANGKATMTSEQITLSERPFYQVQLSDRNPELSWRTFSVTKSPARLAGTMTMLTDYLDMDDKPRRAYSYSPGQRRIKLAPEFSYDTPIAELGGLLFFDELFLFSGRMDRFDFKLVGKKEMYIPYNGYRAWTCQELKQFAGNTANPTCERWELHRVWVVEATLKPGQRHAMKRRVFYFDEDLSGAGMFDAFDSNDKLFKGSFQTVFQMYDQPGPGTPKTYIYDFSKRSLVLMGDAGPADQKVLPRSMPDIDLTPEAVVNRESAR